MIALGPLVAVVAAIVGRAIGAQLGFLPVGLILMLVLAILIWVVVASAFKKGARGAAVAAVWTACGLLNADIGESLALLDSGAHIVGAHLVDEQAWRGHERVTFADGVARSDVEGTASHLASLGAHTRTTRLDSCTATPIVPSDWTTATQVRVWSIDDSGPSSTPYERQVFHPTTHLSDDCKRAVQRAVAAHALVVAPDAVYLERLTARVDPSGLRASGIAVVVFTSAIWIIVVIVQLVRRRR